MARKTKQAQAMLDAAKATLTQREAIRAALVSLGHVPSDADIDAGMRAWGATLVVPTAAPVEAPAKAPKAPKAPKAKAETPAWLIQRGKNSATRKALWAQHATELNKLAPDAKAARWAALKAAAGVK